MSRRKLLLADDSITIQKVVNLTFADEGIDVVTVGDGRAAVAHLASEIPDIVLADVNMPGPTGYEICERLRANEASKDVPVILLVGSFEPFDESEATRVGANAYLTKPFQSIKQLIRQVNELIETVPQPAEEAASAISELPTEVPGFETSITQEISPITAEPVVEGALTADEPLVAEPASAEAAPRYFDDLGYETTSPTNDIAQQSPPSKAEDIDNLYAQSLSGGADHEFSDVGIDDEMIETSYSAPESSEQIGSFEVESVSSETVEAPAGESELVAEPTQEQPLASTETEVGFRSGYDQRFPDDPSKFENTISYENWRPADMRPAESQSPVDTSLETAPLNEPSSQSAEAESPAAVPEDTIRMENRFETTDSASYQFDDVDLLDLSGDTAAAVEITSPANAHEQGSNKQLVTLSPELIEMIAQRVVEKMSEKY